MSDQVPLQFQPLQPHEFYSLPVGFEYSHEISETSNTDAFDARVDARDLSRCVVCEWYVTRKQGGVHIQEYDEHIL
jgi:hypothetical protein